MRRMGFLFGKGRTEECSEECARGKINNLIPLILKCNPINMYATLARLIASQMFFEIICNLCNTKNEMLVLSKLRK